MPRPLTMRAEIRCDHATGQVVQAAAQDLVRIGGSPVLVRGDALGRPVRGCVAIPPLKPCLVTLTEDAGHSTLVFVRGTPVLLATLKGTTSGDPPGTVTFRVARPGQGVVEAP